MINTRMLKFQRAGVFWVFILRNVQPVAQEVRLSKLPGPFGAFTGSVSSGIHNRIREKV